MDDFDKTRRIQIFLEKLSKEYGSPSCALDYGTPYELLVAVILSAQCTDIRVNLVTAELFKVARTPQQMLSLGQERLAGIIRCVGLYGAKSRNIIAMSAALLDRHGGEVPTRREELIRLPGVGEKTAAVVLIEAFGGAAIPVDTHVFRVMRRLPLSEKENPNAMMRELESLVPEESRAVFHRLAVTHGRRCCKARSPMCASCPISLICDGTVGPGQEREIE